MILSLFTRGAVTGHSYECAYHYDCFKRQFKDNGLDPVLRHSVAASTQKSRFDNTR